MSLLGAVWQLYLFYGVIIGIGMSGSFVPLASTVARWFVARRGIMTGIVVAGIGIGTLIAPPVASWLISTYGWRTSYIIMGSLVLVVAVLVAQLLRRDPAQIGQVPYGRKEEGEEGLKLATEGFSLKEAVYTRQFWLVFTMLFCFGFSVFALIVHLVPHATDLGISAAGAATILAVAGGTDIVGRIVLGSATDRSGPRQVFIISFIMLSAALFCVVPATEMWMLYLFAAVLGFTHGGMGASEPPLVAGLFGLRSHGLILGVVAFSFTIGAAVGPFLTGYIFDVTGSYQSAFLVCAAIGIVGLVLIALVRPIKG